MAFAVSHGLGMSQAQQTDAGARSWASAAPSSGPDTSWMPAGFTDLAKDGTTGIHRTEPVDPSCQTEATSCIGYQVTTRDGCPSGFWIRLHVLNRIGVKINEGWAIGPPIWPGEIAEVTIAWDGPPGERYHITEFECRWPTSG